MILLNNFIKPKQEIIPANLKSIRMKNFMFLAILVIAMFSCSKDQLTDPNASKSYVKAISGQFIPKDGDVTLKLAPLVGGHQIDCWDKKTLGAPWTVIDGTEFITGSAPAVDWAGYAIGNPAWYLSGSVYITYCPASLPMRVVITAKIGGVNSTPSYLGIWEGIPDQASFPITIQDRRIGDVVTLNTDALTGLPGYATMSFDVVYTKNVIDLAKTSMSSPVTDVNWAVYEYSSHVATTTTLDATKNLVNRVVYDGLDAKITGITINIHVDNTTITKTVADAGMGHGLQITLTTSKTGWYNSGTMTVTENDITATQVDVPVN